MTRTPDEGEGADLARPRAPRVATSLRAALPGDLLPLTARGEIMSRAAYRARVALGWTWFGVAVVFVGAFWGGVLQSAFVGAAAGGGTAALLLVRWRRTRGALLRATAQLAAGRPAEARAALRALTRTKLDAQSAFVRDYLDLRIDWALGRHQVALEKATRLLHRFPRSLRVACERAWLLAITGQVDAAIEALVAQPKPTSVYLALVRAGAELRVAFLVGELPAGFDFEGLHALAREVLQTSLFGAFCALLAWGFQKRGDAGMARHLLDEVPARLQGVDLAKVDPPLAAWLVAATNAPPNDEPGSGAGQP